MEPRIRKGNEVKTEGRIRNPNHPQKGDNTRVDPIRRLEDVQSIKRLLSDNPRDLLLFTMGINNGLRVGDLLRLRVKEWRTFGMGICKHGSHPCALISGVEYERADPQDISLDITLIKKLTFC